MVKKNILAVALLSLSSVSAMAGGLNTNTNQNAAYVRQMSQNGVIGIEGMYANPAGTAFLTDGWHLSLNSQSAWQQRNVVSTFKMFQMNAMDQNATHEFNGRAKAPVIPSFSLSYNKDKWSVNLHFGLGGGGGKCDFADGLGDFEALVAGSIAQGVIKNIATGFGAQAGSAIVGQYMAAGMSQADAMAKMQQDAAAYGMNEFATHPTNYLSGYSLNQNMSGRSYIFGVQLGATYKVLDNLSVFGGVRVVYGTNNYKGNINGITMYMPNNTKLTEKENTALAGVEMNCDQTAVGATPVIGVDYKVNKYFNIAAKYEAPTKMNYKNSTKTLVAAPNYTEEGGALAKFVDGNKVREDIPGILAIGAMGSPTDWCRIMLGSNIYFDKSVRTGINGNNVKGAGIDKNTWEVNAGAEFDLCKYLTFSLSYQHTQYGLADDGMTGLSFNNSNNMIGGGFRIKPHKMVNIDLGYMHTFYNDRSVTSTTALGEKVDLYSRKNDVFGVGVNLEF